MDQRAHDAGAGHAERVAEGDAAATGVELVPADAEVLGRRDDLGGERLVDLDEVDVVDGHAGAAEGLAAGLDRAEAHDLGVEARDTRRHDAGERGEAELLGLGVAHHDDSSGAIVERAGVAGRDRAAGAEHGVEARELLDGGAGADAVVLADDAAVGQGDGGDLGGPEAVLERLGGELLGAGGELVLLLAADLLLLGDVLGGVTHAHVDVGQADRRGPVALVAGLAGGGAGAGVVELRVGGAVVGHTVDEAADRLDAGSEEDVALAGLDGVAGHADRLERRRAVAVDGDAGDVRHVGQHRDDAGEVHAGLTGGLAAAQDEVLDEVAVERRHLLEDGVDDLRGEVVGTHVDQRTLHGPPDGRAGGGDDDCFRHWTWLPLGWVGGDCRCRMLPAGNNGERTERCTRSVLQIRPWRGGSAGQNR